MSARARLSSSLRALLGPWAGDRAAPLPELPPGLSPSLLPLVRDAVATLVHYQGVAYARLYLHRLRRFVGRRDVDEAVFAEIVRLMRDRMAYDDSVRLAQLTLDEAGEAQHPVRRHCRFRLDDLLEPLPRQIAGPILYGLTKFDLAGRMITRRYSGETAASRLRLRIESSLRRWRALGGGYERERVWVERWLHMIDRALVKQPAAATAIIDTATMIRGYGEPYRRALVDWHLIIDGLVKPALDGALVLPDLAGAIIRARRATIGDFEHTGLRAAIAEIRDDAGKAAS